MQSSKGSFLQEYPIAKIFDLVDAQETLKNEIDKIAAFVQDCKKDQSLISSTNVSSTKIDEVGDFLNRGPYAAATIDRSVLLDTAKQKHGLSDLVSKSSLNTLSFLESASSVATSSSASSSALSSSSAMNVSSLINKCIDAKVCSKF